MKKKEDVNEEDGIKEIKIRIVETKKKDGVARAVDVKLDNMGFVEVIATLEIVKTRMLVNQTMGQPPGDMSYVG